MYNLTDKFVRSWLTSEWHLGLASCLLYRNFLFKRNVVTAFVPSPLVCSQLLTWTTCWWVSRDTWVQIPGWTRSLTCLHVPASILPRAWNSFWTRNWDWRMEPCSFHRKFLEHKEYIFRINVVYWGVYVWNHNKNGVETHVPWREQSRAEQGRAGQGRAGQGRAWEDRTKQGRAEQSKSRATQRNQI